MSEFTDEKVLVNGPVDQEETKQETEVLETEAETAEQEASEAEVVAVPAGETPEDAQPEAGDSEVEPVAEVETADSGTEPVGEAETEAPVAQDESGKGVSEQILEDYSDIPTPVPNTIITGKVVQVGPDEVLVDIGYKSEGRIPINEMGLKPNQQPSDVFAEDMEIDVWVLKVDDAEDNVVLSKRRADVQKAWSELEQLYAEGKPITAEVTQAVKGGLL